MVNRDADAVVHGGRWNAIRTGIKRRAHTPDGFEGKGYFHEYRIYHGDTEVGTYCGRNKREAIKGFREMGNASR